MNKFMKKAVVGAMIGTSLLFFPSKNECVEDAKNGLGVTFFRMKFDIGPSETKYIKSTKLKENIPLFSSFYPDKYYNRLRLFEETNSRLKQGILAKPNRSKYSNRLSELKNKINYAQTHYCKEQLDVKFDYRTAFLTYRYFDKSKAIIEAKELKKLGVIKNFDEYMIFINMCRFWPLTKIYSKNAGGNKEIDPRISALMIAAESRFDSRYKEKNREGYYDVGLSRINEKYANYFEDLYRNNPYWIDSQDYTYPSNNLLLGILIMKDRCISAGVKGIFENVKPINLLRAYNGHVTSAVDFKDTTEIHINFTKCMQFLRLLPYIERAVANGAMIDWSAVKRSKFDEIIKYIPSRHAAHLLKCVCNWAEPDTKRYPYIKEQDLSRELNKIFYIDYSEGGRLARNDAEKNAMKSLNWMKRNLEGNENYDGSYILTEKGVVVNLAGYKMYITNTPRFVESAYSPRAFNSE